MFELKEREYIDGKPHGGIWFGKCIVFHHQISENDERMDDYEKMLRIPFEITKLEIRHEEIILRPISIHALDPLNQCNTMVFKGMLWGRAYKVARLISKRVKRYQKRFVNGRRRRVRIEKETIIRGHVCKIKGPRYAKMTELAL